MATLALASTAAAQSPRQVHGADAVFVSAEAVVVWSVLRGADESSTVVVITVAPRGAAVGGLAADGVDPFTRARVPRGGRCRWSAPIRCACREARSRITRAPSSTWPRRSTI